MLQTALAIVSTVMTLVNEAVAVGVNAAPLVSWAREVLDSNAAPGDAEWDRLDAFVKEWEGNFQLAARDPDQPALDLEPAPDSDSLTGDQVTQSGQQTDT